MNSSPVIWRRRLSCAVVGVALGMTAAAQEPAAGAAEPAAPALVALGKTLFEDARLSSTGTMSCATCHRPERSFTEDKPRAIGQTGADLGRNTPTLLGLASVASFPAPGEPRRPQTMIPLEVRVLAPLRDHLEMDVSADAVVARISADDAYVQNFSGAFDEPSEGPKTAGASAAVTTRRLGVALAAYIRSLPHYEGPTHAALAGGNVQLDAGVARGLELFRDQGRCQSCHSGSGLTDGAMHVVGPFRLPNGGGNHIILPLPVQQVATTRPSSEEPVQDAAKRQAVRFTNVHVVGGGYGQLSFERQTLPLLDVARTGPYFRDGSIGTLSDAVRRHVEDLRLVGAKRAEILDSPHVLMTEARTKSKPRRPPAWSESAKAQLASDDWIPADLTEQQIADLVAFLTSLSPAD